MKTKKKFRPGTEGAGKKSAYSKFRRIKRIVNGWKEMKIVSSEDAINRIKNIVED